MKNFPRAVYVALGTLVVLGFVHLSLTTDRTLFAREDEEFSLIIPGIRIGGPPQINKRGPMTHLTRRNNPNRPPIGHFNANAIQDTVSDTPHEGFAVGVPTPNPKYGQPVYSQLLIDHTFSDPASSPVSVNFTPPNVTFNRVVLTVNESVDKIQYDRLSHVFVGGAEVWRPSTIEPNNYRRTSSAKKDVSVYVSLFKEPTEIRMELGNVIEGRIQGDFDTQLYVDFYQVDETVLAEDDDVSVSASADIKPSFLSTLDAPQVHALGYEHIPETPFSVKLPQVNGNTTRLTLSVFASGNADEEFWYLNILDKYANSSVGGGTSQRHGPARFIQVYFNGERIATQVPHQVVFTGGLSPAYWMPVVSNNAFDLRSYDFDVTALVPELAKGPGTLDIVVSNGIDEFSGASDGVGSNWIVSANLLAYENLEVKSSSGTFRTEKQDSGNSAGRLSNETYGQAVAAHYSSTLELTIEYTLVSGESVSVDSLLYTTSLVFNFWAYDDVAESMGHLGRASRTLRLTVGDTVSQVDAEFNYPFFYEATNNGSLIFNSIDTQILLDGTAVVQQTSPQRGFYSTAGANLTTDYSLQLGELEFHRRVVGGLTRSGESVYSDDTTSSAGHFFDVSSLVVGELLYKGVKEFFRKGFHGWDSLVDGFLARVDATGVGSKLEGAHEN